MTKRSQKKPDPFAAAVALFGTQTALANAIGISQQCLNRAIRSGRVSPRVAMDIHRLTDGRVTADQLRPDLWRHPSHVPIDWAA